MERLPSFYGRTVSQLKKYSVTKKKTIGKTKKVGKKYPKVRAPKGKSQIEAKP